MAAEVYAKAPTEKKSSTHPGIRIPIDSQFIRPQYHGSCAALRRAVAVQAPVKKQGKIVHGREASMPMKKKAKKKKKH
jgi:hypothetical protein